MSFLKNIVRAQAFWIWVSVFMIALFMSTQDSPFVSGDNLSNISRNAAFVALVALAQTVVIASGGIDLSVGSLIGLSSVCAARVMNEGGSLELGILAGLGTGLLFGMINGAMIAYARLSPFIVTLAALSIARSLAIVVSENKTLYELGPDQERLFSLFGGEYGGVALPVWIVIALAVILTIVLKHTRWGESVFAVGGNIDAARRCGVPVARVTWSVYALSGLFSGISAVLYVAWLGSISSSHGSGEELRIIAASVLGGANLAGGEGSVVGALGGALLVEVIRNMLLLQGVNPNWQGTFVGVCILCAIVLERVYRRSR